MKLINLSVMAIKVLFGRASKVVVTKDNTTIVEGNGESERIASRVAQIRSQLEETTSEFDKEKLQERLAKLAGGVAVVKVGAATETELKERKLRIEDALNATRAAVEEGIHYLFHETISSSCSCNSNHSLDKLSCFSFN